MSYVTCCIFHTTMLKCMQLDWRSSRELISCSLGGKMKEDEILKVEVGDGQAYALPLLSDGDDIPPASAGFRHRLEQHSKIVLLVWKLRHAVQSGELEPLDQFVQRVLGEDDSKSLLGYFQIVAPQVTNLSNPSGWGVLGYQLKMTRPQFEQSFLLGWVCASGQDPGSFSAPEQLEALKLQYLSQYGYVEGPNDCDYALTVALEAYDKSAALWSRQSVEN